MALHAATAPPLQPMALHRPRTTSPATSLSPYPCIPLLRIRPFLLSPAKLRPRMPRSVPRITASATAAPVGPDFMDALERCFSLPSVAEATFCSSPAATPAASMPMMKGGKYGAIGAVTLEKSKLDLSKKSMRSNPETAIGGGGGDIGKKIFHGGGGGDDGGDDDDDDYFDDFDEGDEGDDGGLFRRRIVFQELFDRKFVDSVLQEWYKSMIDLPAGLRQAYELGLVSSAQMVQFLAFNARPTVTRAVSRSTPEWLSRAFIGRMIADPSFLYKLILEESATCAYSAWWEFKNRKERIKQEWHLALLNILTVMTCNGIIVWSLAPCRSYGNTFRTDLQNSIQKLPNNIFEKDYLMREFDLQKRVYSFFYKAAEFSLLGSTAGTVQSVLSNFFSSKKDERLSVTVPSVSTNALGYGAYLGFYANLRYQILNGVDRAMINHFDVLKVAFCFSTALRILNAHLGEASRLASLGVEADTLSQSDNLPKPYNKPSNAIENPSSKWHISNHTAMMGLWLPGLKQGSDEPDSIPSKPHRKRTIRRKANASSS
ncbi:protein RETICULATA-RELATED 1, chloroplastic-like [Zingiber officinale]|uniref:protein RETICULATA-RELATED 1, chloroplastic-like n=1 Tax=Zingiber officinale TaxID=94328 RepID=UPI001C4C7F58|nr:protein RETICULATA-RELATED 1, chloroplastic-like [Zingiber officinale]